MMVERPDPSGAAPPLVVRAQEANRTLLAGPSYRLGRDPDSDLVVDEPRVSWQHAIFRLDGGQWLLEDLGSTNGTWLGPRRV
jgi:pSer/pThr/pTyr-binding forkhead associated (FHA) protein